MLDLSPEVLAAVTLIIAAFGVDLDSCLEDIEDEYLRGCSQNEDQGNGGPPPTFDHFALVSVHDIIKNGMNRK